MIEIERKKLDLMHSVGKEQEDRDTPVISWWASEII
jgi:hypothetical protein